MREVLAGSRLSATSGVWHPILNENNQFCFFTDGKETKRANMIALRNHARRFYMT